MTERRIPRAEVPSDLVPFRDVCARLGIHYVTGARHRDAGLFPLEVLKIGHRYYCRRDELEHYVRARRAS